MNTHSVFKGIDTPSACSKAIVLASIGVTIMCFLADCEKQPLKASDSAPSDIEALSEDIKRSVRELEYPDKVAKDFVLMVLNWKDEQGKPVLIAWKKGLAKAKEDCEQGKIPKDQIAKVEEITARELSQRIRKEIGPDLKAEFFDLADVVKYKQAQCLGYSQLLFVLGNSIGLSVKVIAQLDHSANIVHLFDSKVIIADLACPPSPIITKPFLLEQEYKETGDHYELPPDHVLGLLFEDENGQLRAFYNPFGVRVEKLERLLDKFSRFQILDRNGLIADIYTSRGNIYGRLSKYDEAISNQTKAIKLNPKSAFAYYNRAGSYWRSGQLPEAAFDYSMAIKLAPDFVEAYKNRALVYSVIFRATKDPSDYGKALFDFNRAIELNSSDATIYYYSGNLRTRAGKYSEAIADYTRAIQLDPQKAKVYSSRGSVYGKVGQLTKAINDFSKAIEFNPTDGVAYGRRGFAYALSGKSEQAKKDLLKAVELSPALKAMAKQTSDRFKLGLHFD